MYTAFSYTDMAMIKLIYKLVTVRDYLNCQHHCSYALGPLLSKIKVPWTGALWYHNGSDNWDGF